MNFFYTGEVERFAIGYLVGRFLYRIFAFVRNWYLGGFLVIGRHTLALLESLDQTFAFKLTLRHFFQPLYQDHTVLGHTLGLFFRTSRLVGGGIIYFFVIFLAVVLYCAWAAAPIIIVYRGFFL